MKRLSHLMKAMMAGALLSQSIIAPVIAQPRQEDAGEEIAKDSNTEINVKNAEIASITGHRMETVDKILETYLSRTRALAQGAIEKLERRLARPALRLVAG